MRTRTAALFAAVATLALAGARTADAQGLGERIGGALDRGARSVGRAAERAGAATGAAAERGLAWTGRKLRGAGKRESRPGQGR